MKKALLIGAGVALVGSAGMAATTNAMGGGSLWNWNFSSKSDSFDAELASSLSTEFSLDEDQVAAVIEQVRDGQFDVYDDKQEAKLQKALSDQRITQEQYDTIVEKLKEIDVLIDRIDDEEGETRKETAGEIKSAYRSLISWMKDEEISVRLIVHSPYLHHESHWYGHSHRH